MSLLLAALLILQLLPYSAAAAQDDVPTWHMEGDQLVISGEIPDYATFDDPTIPWFQERYHITSVVVEEGVTQIGDYSLNNLLHLTEVSLPSTLRRIGTQAISAAPLLRQLEIPAGVTEIGDNAFQGNAADMTLTVYSRNCTFGFHPFGFHWDSDLWQDVVDETALLRGYLGSTAEAYAKETGVAFSPLGTEGWDPAWNVQLEPIDEDDRRDEFGRIHISTEEELRAIADDLTASYILDADISLSSPWVMPYGTFSGILDGDGHQIVGLTMDDTRGSMQGFFQDLSGTVCNLTIQGAQLTNRQTHPRVGILAASGGGSVINCTISGQITIDAAGYAMAGGITGGGGSFTDCDSSVEIDVSIVEGATVGALAAEDAVITSCHSSGSITLTQSASHADGAFNAFGLKGTVRESENSCDITVSTQNSIAFVAALSGAFYCQNSGAIRVTSVTGQASGGGGEHVSFCTNNGTVYAEVTQGGSNSLVSAFGLRDAVGSTNNASVFGQAVSAEVYCEGLSGPYDETGTPEAEGYNYGDVTALVTNSTATVKAVRALRHGGENTGAATARATNGKAVAYGAEECAYFSNTGSVTATVTGGSQVALAVGLFSCTDATQSAAIFASHDGSASALARGCDSSTRCVNSGSVSADGYLQSGAVGINNGSNCTNNGAITAISRSQAREPVPSVYCYGFQGGSGHSSTGSVSATGSLYGYNTTTTEALVWYSSVRAGNSAQVNASIPGFYSVSTSSSESVYVHFVKGQGYVGPTNTAGTNNDNEEWCLVQTFTANPGAATPPTPQQPEEPELTADVSIAGISLHESRNGFAIRSVAVNCGSLSAPSASAGDAGIPSLSLQVALFNAGNGLGGSQTISLTLPDGLSFSSGTMVSTSNVSLPDVPAGEIARAWVEVYPLYSETCVDGAKLTGTYLDESGRETAYEVMSCRYYLPQGRFDYAKVYYGIAEQDENCRIFKYYQWDAAAFTGSSDRYQTSSMQLSALLSWAVYLYHDGEEEMAEEMLTALGFTCAVTDGESTAMDSKRLYARKIFVADGQVFALVAASTLGTVDVPGWIGNLAFISTDKYHASFDAVQQKVGQELTRYVQEYGAGASVKYLLTGHSRGGAVANLLAASMDRSSDIDHDDIFCYTFAAPNCVRDDGDLTQARYQNIFNLVNFNDVVGYIPGCYAKYGVSLFYEHEVDTVSSLYISQLRAFSTDTFLLGDADGMRMSLSLSFAAPQIDRILTKHSMTCYIEDVWVLDVAQDLPISLEQANLRQDDLSRQYIDGFVTGMEYTTLILNVLKNAGIKSYQSLVRRTASEKRVLATLRKLLRNTEAELEEEITNLIYSPLEDELGRGLLRYGIAQLKCPVDVAVYNSSGTCVARIVDDQLVDGDSSVGVLIENDQKTLLLPLDQGPYRLEASGYRDGEMEVLYRQVDGGETTALDVYQSIAVERGETAAVLLTPASTGGSFTVTDGSQALLEPDISSQGSVPTHTVTVTAAADVYLSGGGDYPHGAYTSLYAGDYGDAEQVFLGWYTGDTLLSLSQVLEVPVLSDLTVEARFGSASQLPTAIAGATRTAAGVEARLQGIKADAILLAAVYDESGRLAASAQAAVPAGAVEATLPLPSAAGEVRLFLLNAETYAPACACYDLSKT